MLPYAEKKERREWGEKNVALQGPVAQEAAEPPAPLPASCGRLIKRPRSRPAIQAIDQLPSSFSAVAVSGLQMRIGVEFKFQTFLNFRTFTVP